MIHSEDFIISTVRTYNFSLPTENKDKEDHPCPQTLNIDFNTTSVIEKHIKYTRLTNVDKYKLLPLLFGLL